jgi:hypothetical protein
MLTEATYRMLVETSDTHIESSLTVIAEAAGLAGSGHAAVLGCGTCAEIPVSLLYETFDRVDLVDLDEHVLRVAETRCRSSEETGGSRAFHHADLTGLIPQVVPPAREIAAGTAGPLECLDSLGALLASTTPSFWRPLGAEKYDLIVCSGVLTQLQAAVRGRVESIFLDRFPGQGHVLSTHETWRRRVWGWARQLEAGFIDHLDALSARGGVVYLSDTVHTCWLIYSRPDMFTTEGTWIATRTPRLADYLHPWHEIASEREWRWFRREQEGPYWGRLYGVQAIVYGSPSSTERKATGAAAALQRKRRSNGWRGTRNP